VTSVYLVERSSCPSCLVWSVAKRWPKLDLDVTSLVGTSPEEEAAGEQDQRSGAGTKEAQALGFGSWECRLTRFRCRSMTGHHFESTVPSRLCALCI